MKVAKFAIKAIVVIWWGAYIFFFLAWSTDMCQFLDALS